MERKTKRIYIRLTPDDEALFRRKAARYQTVSAMVRDAVKQFDDTATLGKIDALHAMMEYYKRYEQQLSWLGRLDFGADVREGGVSLGYVGDSYI